MARPTGAARPSRDSPHVTPHCRHFHRLLVHFERPDDFDLQNYWKNWKRATTEANRFEYWVTARIAPNLVPYLSNYFGEEVESQVRNAAPDEGGWINLTLPFEHFFAARDYFLGGGNATQILSPEPLRLSVIDHARQVLVNYPEKDEGQP